jgi:hypothetical protein
MTAVSDKGNVIRSGPDGIFMNADLEVISACRNKTAELEF